MEIIKPPKQEFMASIERCEPAAVDHTSRIGAKTCKRLYFYTIVLGFRDKESPPFFAFGSAYHRFREVLETSKQYKEQDQFEEAILEALRVFGNVDPSIGSPFDFLTRERLLKSCKKAAVYRNRESKNVKVLKFGDEPAVEKSFEVILADGKTRRGGKIDQFLNYGGKDAIRDFKTSSKNLSYYDRTLDPNDQFTGYLVGASKLAQRHIGLLVVEVLHNDRSSGPTIKPFFATRTEWQLAQWEKEQVIVEKELEICREADIWPMEEKHCPFCKFRSVCKSGTEQAQLTQLKREFVQHPWDYKTLGEDNG